MINTMRALRFWKNWGLVSRLMLAVGIAIITGGGVQTALLTTRLSEAARLGCNLAVITTLPGSKSQQNAQRHGFELLYTRAILVRDPT